MKSSPRSPQLEKARAQQWRPDAAKNKFKKTQKKQNPYAANSLSYAYCIIQAIYLICIVQISSHFVMCI